MRSDPSPGWTVAARPDDRRLALAVCRLLSVTHRRPFASRSEAGAGKSARGAVGDREWRPPWSSCSASSPSPTCSARSRARASSPGRRGIDVTKSGSGNPGASNTFRLLGWKAGLVVLLLDMGKGALAAGVGSALDGHRGAYILGVAAVLGHVFPVTRHFKGGRGVATAAGVLGGAVPPRRPASLGGRVVRDRTRSAQGVDRVGRVRGPVPDHRRGRAAHRGATSP